ncbi:MAG TPA: hypothetical protein VHS08_06905 [Candidatus Acidoferrales bacterium]|jgi:hypothetical protein|nr:hypothetical protein [Candidatus Acidoferrales bacterium]
MLDQQVADLDALVEELEKSATAPDSEALLKLANILAKPFDVKTDEVAVFKLVPKYKSLKFVIPEKLTPVGTIPLTSTTALAARTARDRKGELANNFGTSRHANVFEAVPLGRAPSEMIQKIMSAPILDGKAIHGVVQICRKAGRLADAGPDFTQKDLRALSALSPMLDRFLRLCKLD